VTKVCEIALQPNSGYENLTVTFSTLLRGPFDKFVDRRQCAAVMQREEVTVTPSCSGRGNIVVA
jgi:hypothetical protein